AKTDGHLVVRVVDDTRLVLTDVSTDAPRVTARLPLPTGGYGSELLLAGDHVLVTLQYAGEQGPRRLRGPTPVDVAPDRTRLVDIDISDPSAPKVLHQDLYSGGQVSVRRYGATVRLVTSTGRPQLPFTHPGKHLTAREATGRNRALVRASTIEDWLPTVTTDGVRTRLVGCDQVLRPPTWAGSSTVAVTTFPADDPEQRSTVALTADGQVVYSSADRLYVTSTDRPVGGVRPLARDLRPPGGQLRTSVHAFALDGPRTTYVGSGHVYGIVRDRWSFDEHDGHLRVAWSKTGSRGNVNRNGITVFSEAGGALVGAGRISGLGHGDTLQSVRWFDDLAVLVTYRQVDPLVTVDLTDPTRPVALGVLKVPGYSGYLHPLGNGLLLGAGVTAATRTAEQGSQVAVFDIADLRKPVQVSRHAFGPDTGLSVLDDPRAFSWLPDSRTAVTAVVDWTTSRATLVALTVGAHGHLVVRTLARLNTEWQPRTLALPEHRIAVLDHHRIRVLHLG
ncbi:MAG: beta-propeller domain-containing protein, partial [Marmoricola sp.]